jgi:hypothetical protein
MDSVFAVPASGRCRDPQWLLLDRRSPRLAVSVAGPGCSPQITHRIVPDANIGCSASAAAPGSALAAICDSLRDLPMTAWLRRVDNLLVPIDGYTFLLR